MPSALQPVDWSVFRDEAILLATIILMLVVDLVRPLPVSASGGNRHGQGSVSPAAWILLAGSLIALGCNLAAPVRDANVWNGMYVVDALSRYFKTLFLLSLALVVLSAVRFLKRHPHQGEFYFFLGSSTLGMMLLVGAGELISLFVTLELTSISLYLLASMDKGNVRSQEAGLKYLLIGAFSTALFLFGVSLLYAVCGSTKLADLNATAAAHPGDPLMLFGLIFVLAAMGFKIAAVPFHMWAPDVYEGGPTPMVAFASVASKAAGFAVMLRIFLGALGSMKEDWAFLLAVMAALTMVVGSFVAIPQTNIKRLLAYSSVAQAGYLLIGFVVGTERGISALLFYLLVYVFTNLGAFLSVIVCSQHTGSDEIASYAGLARRSPLLALVFLISLLSLAGIPPLGGFVGKLYLFAAAMEHADQFLWLVVLAVLLSIVSLYYYLLIIRQMYMEAPKEEGRIPVGAAATVALVCCMAGILVTGIWPTGLIDATIAVAHSFLNS